MITPLNTVFLSLEKALQDEIILNNGLKLYKAADYDIEWSSTVTGTVAGIPKHATGLCADVCEKLKIGDEIAFSYRVVSSRNFPKTDDFFSPVIEGTPTRKQYINHKGDNISVVAMPPIHGKFNKIWVGLLTDKKGAYLDGRQGNEADIDEWLSHFKFSGVQDFNFENLILSDKTNLWRCQFTEILAKKKKDKIVAINDRIICEPLEFSIKERVELESAIALPYEEVKIRYIDRAKIVSGGIEMGFREGDVIAFPSSYCEKYTLWDKNYYLIKKRHVIGRWQ